MTRSLPGSLFLFEEWAYDFIVSMLSFCAFNLFISTFFYLLLLHVSNLLVLFSRFLYCDFFFLDFNSLRFLI